MSYNVPVVYDVLVAGQANAKALNILSVISNYAWHITFRLYTTFWTPVQANAKAYNSILTPPLRLQGVQNVAEVLRGNEAESRLT